MSLDGLAAFVDRQKTRVPGEGLSVLYPRLEPSDLRTDIPPQVQASLREVRETLTSVEVLRTEVGNSQTGRW
jgi:hypothetical protein